MKIGYRRMGEINRLLAEEIASDFMTYTLKVMNRGKIVSQGGKITY